MLICSTKVLNGHQQDELACRGTVSLHFENILHMHCRFHIRTCHVMLLLFLLLVFRSWSALCHSSLEILSSHLILNTDRKHLLTKICIFSWFIFIARHVSQPQSKSDFTLELKIRSFIFAVSSLDFQMFLGMWNMALAFPILITPSLTAPLCLSMMLPIQQDRSVTGGVGSWYFGLLLANFQATFCGRSD